MRGQRAVDRTGLGSRRTLAVGDLAGAELLLGSLAELEAPPYADIDPDDVELLPSERERLHPAGYSVRYLAISKARHGKAR